MRRTTARIRAALRLCFSITLFASAFAGVFFVGAMIHSLGHVSDYPPKAILHTGALFSVFGALYGTIVTLDRNCDLSVRARPWVRSFKLPRLRAGLGAVWGGLAVHLVNHLLSRQTPVLAVVLGAVIGALLGWLGWRWAKFVDF